MDGKLKILVLEDVQMDFELMEHQLEKENIAFISKRVENKADFKKELKIFAPDVILSDYSLPQFDGLSALKLAKEQTPDIPFIIVTGSLSEETAVTTMKAGAWDYVMKDKLIRLGPAVVEALKLKDEIEKRKQAENRIVHLNSVLKAIRNVNQLVVVEKDRDRLLQKVCDALIGTRGYYAAWIGFSEDEKTFSVVKGSGFKPGVSRFIKQVISGDHPHCIKKALAQKEKFLIIDKSRTCGDCFFKDECINKEAAIIRIEHAGRLLGLLAILLAPGISVDDEERTLLQEAAGDIAFALHDMELEKRRKQAEEMLRFTQFAIDQSSDAAFWMGQDARFIYVNEAACNALGYSREELLTMTVHDIDLDFPKEVWADHWADLKNRRSFVIESHQQTKDGKVFPIELKVNYLEFGGNEYNCAFARNITERKQAEKALRENEEKYRSLIESSADPIYLINRDLEYIYANKILLSRLGKSGSQVFGHNYGEFHSPEGTKLFSERIESVFKSEEPVFYEYRSARDGRYFLRTLNPVINQDTGAADSITVFSKDITDLKQSEEKLYMANKRLQHLLFSSTTVIYSCETSGDYGITYSSENVLIITGYLSFNFIKDPKFWIDHIHPEDRKFVLEKMSTISKTENLEIEYRFRKKEGKYIWLHDTKKLIRDEHGAPVEMVGSLLDVTERKQAVKALEESEKNFRALVENSFDGIMINDIRGHYLYSNKSAAEISGYSVDELLKLNVKDLTPSEDVKKVMERIKNRIKNRTVPSYFEGVCIQKDGNEIQLEITAGATTWKDIPAEIISMRNITERKKMEQQLLQSQKMETVGNLAGGVAHDFNNLLTIIQGNAQMMQMDIGKDDSNYHRIGQIINASTRAANLTRQLLLFSRKQMMELLPINLNDTITNLLKMLKRLIGEDISIRTNLQSDLWIVNADESNIEQVIMNICVNARDAMPDGGSLIIKTENIHLSKKECKIIPESYSGNFIRFMIEDSGTGIPQDIIDKIFEPFFSTKEVGKGTGLGLSVVYGIVKKHNGWINVYSEPDKGTIFKIYLPVTSKAIEKKTEIASADVTIYGNGERILLIEDEEDVRRFIASALRQYGFIIYEASSASEARSVFNSEKGKFDLILSDVILPDKNGFDLVEELLSGKKDIPVIMCSGYTEEKVQRSIISKKGFQFIQKPFKVLELLKIISSTVGLKKT